MRLYCFPYAGGSSVLYKEWQKYFNDNIQIVPYELAGHGVRMAEECYQTQSVAVNSILNDIRNDIMDSPYSFFGHSLGASLVFLLIEKIIEEGLPLPKHSFLSGIKPPHFKNEEHGQHLLSDSDFIKILKDNGATPVEFFNNKELLSFFLPILRNDFYLSELKHISLDGIKPFNVNITALFGSDEDISEYEAEEWKYYTKRQFKGHSIDGSHFFINENPKKVIEIVQNTLLQSVES